MADTSNTVINTGSQSTSYSLVVAIRQTSTGQTVFLDAVFPALPPGGSVVQPVDFTLPTLPSPIFSGQNYTVTWQIFELNGSVVLDRVDLAVAAMGQESFQWRQVPLVQSVTVDYLQMGQSPGEGPVLSLPPALLWATWRPTGLFPPSTSRMILLVGCSDNG